MKDLALNYYSKGYGCSGSILKACADKYGLTVTNEMLDMLTGINTGFGVSEMCSVIIVSIMVIGLYFKDEYNVKTKRMAYLSEMKKRVGSFNCGMLISRRRGAGKCSDLIYENCAVLEWILRG